QLEVPLRERNQLLLAGGYAPVYPQASLDEPGMRGVREAVRQVLAAHEPNPAIVIDRQWNMVDANSGAMLFTEGIAPELLGPPLNVMRVSLHPRGAAPRILNLAQWRAHLLARLRREIAQTADAELTQLYSEVRNYQPDLTADEVDAPAAGDVVVPLRYRF